MSQRFVTLVLMMLALLGSRTLLAQNGPGGVGNSTTVFGWWDASQETYSNGSSVAIFNNQINSSNFIQTSASASPTFVSSGINARPALRFNGSSDFLLLQSGSGLSSQNDRTYILVSNVNVGGTQYYLENRFTSTNGNFGLVQIGDFTRAVLKPNSSTSYIRQSNTAAFSPKLLTSVINGGNLVFNNRINGNGYSNPIIPAAVSTGTFTDITLGKIGTFTQYYLNGDIGEIIIFRSALGAAQLNIVENYLAAKYNLTITNDLYAFQATHPNEVAGIGRESATDLNSDAQGSGIVRVFNPSSLDNGDYLIFGHDGVSAAGTGTSNVSGIANETGRSWVADLNTGDVGTVSISFDTGGLGLGLDPSEYRLILDDDGVFDAGSVVSGSAPSGSSVITFNNVDLYSDGPYFKLGHTGTCIAFITGDWNDGTVWSCPGFPDSTKNAEIDPVVEITVTADASVNDLELQANSTLNIDPGVTLVIKGNLTIGSGAVVNADPTSTIIFRGTAGLQQVISPASHTSTFGNLVIANPNGVGMSSGTFNVGGGISVLNGDLTFDTRLVLTSDATSTGHVKSLAGGNLIVNVVTAERFMSGRAANWNDIATVAVPTTISDLDDEIFISGVPGADGYAPSANGGGFISLWYFDNATTQYVPVGNVNDAMPVGRGYEAWLGDNLTTWNAKAWDFQGNALNASLTNINLGAGWNLIGNPLPGFLDFEQVANDHPAINNGEYWFYDANSGNYGTVSGAGSFAPPGQGFWLFCNSATTLTIDPTNHLRSDLSSSTLFKLQADDKEQLKVAVKTAGECTVFGSAIYLRKDDRAFSGIDDLDIPPLKLPDSRAINMWMDYDLQERMVNYVNTEEDHLEIPLHIESGQAGDFEINFQGLEYFKEYQCIKLLNEATGEQIEIYPEATYAFSIDEQLEALDLKLLISKEDYEDCMAPTTFADNEIRAFSVNKTVNIDFFLDRNAEASIQILNNLGQVVYNANTNVSYTRERIDLDHLNNGVYFVHIGVNGKMKTEKVIIQ